ncbi:MAG: T9SS type A sorting domain-containing protein, partial [Ignavibacteriota bacterium]
KNMTDPNNSSDPQHLAYKSVFDGDPFPAPMAQTGVPGIFDLFMGTSKVITLNLLAMHFNQTEGTFVDVANLVGGNVQQGNTITTFNAGYTISILKQVVGEFAGTPLETMAINALNAQANFLVNNLINSEGRFFNQYEIGVGADNSPTLVENQSAAIRGLLAAYQITNDANYLNAAQSGYDYLISHFYVPSAHSFRTEDGNNIATYTPLNFAVISGALREANLVIGVSDAPAIYTRFFKKVANVMQLSEDIATGESGSDSDGDGVPYIPEQPNNLPPVFATEATLDLTITSVEDEIVQVTDYKLEQNYPNPFNPSTIISFDVPNDTYVKLSVYNIIGQEIAQLVSENKKAGHYQVNWNGSDNLGNKVSSGVYLYTLKASDRSFTKKMILTK